MSRKHQSIFVSLLLIGFAYLNLSCFCRGPALTIDLINKSDIIFSGTLIKIDTIAEDEIGDNIILTFKPVKVYKGLNENSISLKSSISSCGFVNETSFNKYIGNLFLIYTERNNGYFRYQSCSNRRLFKTPIKTRYYEEYAQEEYKEKIVKYDSIFSAELIKLDSLIKAGR